MTAGRISIDSRLSRPRSAVYHVLCLRLIMPTWNNDAVNRRQVLQGLIAAALPLGALSCGSGTGPAKGGPLVVGGLPVTL